MLITEEYLDEIADEQGFTDGQTWVLHHWTKSAVWIGKEIPDQVANFLKHCKGFRNGRYEKEAKSQSF